MKNKTLQICLLAMFCALSAIGAQIHIQGSIALDALPAFLAALLLGGPAAPLSARSAICFPRVWRVFP
jgi:biotin transporter BioY